MFRCDTHIHTKYSPDSGASPQSVIARAQKAGLTCLAITDHNTIEGAVRLKAFAPFRVIVGEEIMSSSGEVVGLYLSERIPPGLSPRATMEAIKAQGGLVQVPHPFDPHRTSLGTHTDLNALVPLIDVVETFNAHCVRQRWNDEATDFAKRHGLQGIAASDAHAAGELGRTYMQVPDFEDSAAGLETALRQAMLFTQRPGALLRLAPKLSRLTRAFSR